MVFVSLNWLFCFDVYFDHCQECQCLLDYHLYFSVVLWVILVGFTLKSYSRFYEECSIYFLYSILIYDINNLNFLLNLVSLIVYYLVTECRKLYSL